MKNSSVHKKIVRRYSSWSFNIFGYTSTPPINSSWKPHILKACSHCVLVSGLVARGTRLLWQSATLHAKCVATCQSLWLIVSQDSGGNGKSACRLAPFSLLPPLALLKRHCLSSFRSLVMNVSIRKRVPWKFASERLLPVRLPASKAIRFGFDSGRVSRK